jgi:hypothetical protein
MRAKDLVVDVKKMFDEADATRRERYLGSDRPRLTLRHLNALRKKREVAKMEQAKHVQLVQKMYGDSDDEAK